MSVFPRVCHCFGASLRDQYTQNLFVTHSQTWYKNTLACRWHTVVFVIFISDEVSEHLKKMEECVAEIREWMKKNMLKLSDEETEVLVTSTPSFTDRLHETRIKIRDTSVQASESACNLGVIFDNSLEMSSRLFVGHHLCNWDIYNNNNNIQNLYSALYNLWKTTLRRISGPSRIPWHRIH